MNIWITEKHAIVAPSKSRGQNLRGGHYYDCLRFHISISLFFIWILFNWSITKKQIPIRAKEIIYAKNALNNLRQKVQEYVKNDTKTEGSEEIWELSNELDVSNDPSLRKTFITNKGGIENFETNLEMLALKHEYAYV